MVKVKDLTTEEKIIAAATSIFQQQGYAGARMQTIADEAGINKALLHYYFRSKDLLFQKIFEAFLNKIFPKIEKKLADDMPIYDLLCSIVDLYMDLLKENPSMPGLIISTYNHHPDMVKGIKILIIAAIRNKIAFAVQNKEIKNVDPLQVMTSILSQCIFPYAAKPMIMHAANLNEKQFNNLMVEKKIFIKLQIKKMLFD